jgi:LytS/YehU family sensor histidine kinase
MSTDGIYRSRADFSRRIWFFVLAERSLLAEEDLAKEETKRLCYEKQLLEDHLTLLQAQIEPMLLFRTMRTIAGLYDTDPKRATTMQMHFIQYVRTLLVKTRKQVTTIEQEMELIRTFIELCNLQTEKRVTCRFDIDPQTKALSFPVLLIQPLVESSLQNGLKADSREFEIMIAVHKRGQILQVVISNNASRRTDTSSFQSVFALVRERLHFQFGDNANILQQKSPPLTLIEIPYDTH